MAVPRTARLGEHEITRIGLGTNRLTDTEKDHAFLRAAVEAGLDFIDTAHLYTSGESEKAIGATRAPFADGIVVASKAGYRPGEGRPEVLRRQIEESFERLQTEKITLHYLHRIDPEVPLADSLAVFKEYRDVGRIEHVGLSEVSVEEIEAAREIVPIVAVQNEYNLGERKWDEVIDYCEREGIVFVPFYPLRGAGREVEEYALRHEASPEQIVLAWHLHRSPCVVPIPGTRSIEHLRANLAALEIELSEEELDGLSRGA